MRNNKETDISTFNTDRSAEQNPYAVKDNGTLKFFKGIGKFFLTLISVVLVAGIIAGVSLGIYIFTIASEPTGIDLKAKSMNLTSHIYVENKKSGDFEEYQSLYSTENRIWVDNENIPKAMKDAIVAIEDKRFFEHNGVDWTRTASAVVSLLTGTDSYGGSTLTQQLIKNITDDNEVSLTRKIREICKALKLEQEYTKDQILCAYLNVVNFGNNCQGVEAAANLYFDKSITECSVAECAAIAGITQNPSLWNPLVYPENNRKRREIVIKEMYSQKKISDDEYQKAMDESAKMTFVGFQNDDENEDEDVVQNWYIDQIFYDAQADLAVYYNISEKAASEKLYTEGLKIYSAMDLDMQNYLEQAAKDIDKSYDPNLQIGATLMGFDGRVIATTGSSTKKTGALDWDRSRQSSLQPGSSIKPLFVYPIAIEQKQLYFSSTIKDEPLDKYEWVDGGYIPGPKNAYGSYMGNMLLPDAIEYSSNATAVQAMELIGGPTVAYEQAVTKMNFKMLSEQDSQNTGALSIGGMNGGVSVREMAAAYNYLGNGGLYYKPYTYYYITDSEDNIIIDNRDTIPKKAYSKETAAIMNRLLHYNVTNSMHTKASYARVDGWDIIGKTGTTDNDKDSWFCGLSPYATMAVWSGFDMPASITDYGKATSAKLFSKVMGKYLEGKEQKEYQFPDTLIEASYNHYTGLITSTDYVSGKYVGYYTEDNMPSFGSPAYDDGPTYPWEGGDDSSDTDDTVPVVDPTQGGDENPTQGDDPVPSPTDAPSPQDPTQGGDSGNTPTEPAA